MFIVWKELEKENREFFEMYKKDPPGEESTQKNPSEKRLMIAKIAKDELLMIAKMDIF